MSLVQPGTFYVLPVDDWWRSAPWKIVTPEGQVVGVGVGCLGRFAVECEVDNVRVRNGFGESEVAGAYPMHVERERPRRVRHKKRGSTYEVLGEGEVQLSNPTVSGESGVWTAYKPVCEGDKLVVYRCETDGKLWLRFPDEFDDGRFEDV